MICRDVSFTRARCRIELEARHDPQAFPLYIAHVYVVDDTGGSMRPLGFADGSRLELHGPSVALALSSAMTYLERCFGGLAEPEFECDPSGDRPQEGEVLVTTPPEPLRAFGAP